VLVTTPVHLAACVERMDGGWPAVELVISATAPLSPELAGAVERRLGTRVCEIYGCTEAGSMASRRTLDGPRWRWYEGIGPRQLADGVAVSGEILAGEVRLADRLELHGDGSFSLLGRGADLVKVAGKRASLADLNLKLAAIEGVVEGVFVVPEGAGPESARLGAVAVAPGLDRETLLAALRQRLDPAFVPRPLVLVERLPRNATGKIPREALLALIAGRGGERS
jgi:acyl-coenzyme A synthetase/AMP-(fatty) acid ligase